MKSEFYYIMQGFRTKKHYGKADTRQLLSQQMAFKFPSLPADNPNSTIPDIYPEPMKVMKIRRA